MNSFNFEGVITMPVFSLAGTSEENAKAGKRYNFLTKEGYTQCYMKDYRARIKNLEKRPSDR